MDGIFHELSRKTDPAKLLGYLNFSDGRPDPKFQKGLADAAAFLLASRRPGPVDALHRWLGQALAELEASGSPAFRDATQVRARPRRRARTSPGRVPRAPRRPARPPARRRPVHPVLPRPGLRGGAEAGPAVGRDRTGSSRARSRISTTTSATGRSRSSKPGRTPSTTRTRRSARSRCTSRAPASPRASTPTSSARPSNCSRRPIRSCSTRRASPRTTSTNWRSTRERTTTSTRSTSGRTCCSASGTRTRSTAAGIYRRFVLRQMTLDTLLTWVDPDDRARAATGTSGCSRPRRCWRARS